MAKNQEKEMKKEKETSRKYSNISFRGQTFVGTVISAKPIKSATVEIKRKYSIPKYERYEKRLTRLHVHNPLYIDAREGDIVKVIETRPLSKTIHHVIVEKIGQELDYKGKKMIEEEEKDKISGKKTKEEVKKESGKKSKKSSSKADANKEEQGE